MIKKLRRCFFLVYLLLSLSTLFAQVSNKLLSRSNRLAFGNYLFCEKDYLRAIDELTFILNQNWTDTLQFKVATAYYYMEQYSQAYVEFQRIPKSSSLFQQTEYEKLRSLFKEKRYALLLNKIKQTQRDNEATSSNLLQLRNTVYLLSELPAISEKDFISVFDNTDKTKIREFYNWKTDIPTKSPTLAALMSAVIPGSGKIYADEIGDGITAFILTGLFTYLAIDKFQNNHNSSGWLYTSIASFFYAGNVYGSATAVQNYNAGIKINFNSDVELFVNKRNQFMPKAKWLCK